jgi:hypothetical protein
MPNWAGGVLTAKGRALQAKVEAGQTLELTKMKLGSGTPEPEEIDNLTDLKQPQNIMGISSKNVKNNVCEVTSVILTSNITTPFYAREWGLFANDPDEGEILYMYTTDPNPDYIPDKNSALVISASYALNIAVLNVDNIIVNIDQEGLVTSGILEEVLKNYLPIDTTYVKDITASNATITVTKGNGTTSTATINNVANATKATQDGDGNTINTTYLKLSGGTMKGNIYFTGVTSKTQRTIKNIEFNSGITFTPDFMGFWDWRDNIRVLTYNYNKKELTAGVAINGVTPSTNDNSTKLATTAFVQSLLTNKFTASKQQNGWWKDGNTGMIWQWGVVKESSSSSDYKYFPISFPNSCFIVIGVINEYPVSDFFTPWAYPVDKTKFLIGAEKDYTSVYNMGYIAIGY